MTPWYRDPRTQLLHRGLLHLGLVSGACSERFAPVDPEITLPVGEIPPEHGCPACAAGAGARPPGGDHPAQMASLVAAAPQRWRDKLGWEALALLVTLAALIIVAWPR